MSVLNKKGKRLSRTGAPIVRSRLWLFWPGDGLIKVEPGLA